MKLYDDLSDRIFQELAELMLVNLYRNHDLNLKKQPRHLCYGQEGNGVKVDKQGDRKGTGHVMISYQWESKNIIQKIKKDLEDHNIKVWIDDDKMSDEADVNDAMANAVENSAVFLMGVTAKYGASKNCKKEANYAEVCDIPIIPLMLQDKFKPKGWLGIIMGNKFFHEFTNNKPTPAQFEKLRKKIEGELKEAVAESKDGSTGEGNATKQGEESKAKQPTKKLQPVATKSPRELLWVSPYCRLNPHAACTSRQDGFSHCCCVTTTDPKKEVKEWARKHKLEGDEIKALSKKDIETLLHLREKSPEFFYKRVWKDLKMRKISDVMQFEAALNNWKKEHDKKTDEKEKTSDGPKDGQSDKKNEENKEDKSTEE